MKFAEWLDEEVGRAKELAAHFKVSKGAVSHWKRYGVPLDHMKAVRAFTGEKVTLEEMVPDVRVDEAVKA